MEQVILVDENDVEVGVMEKIEAHMNGGHLHRAFSGICYDGKGRVLIQKRADTKYHNPGLWSNTVCSHPRPGEDVEDACKRRLNEELGFKAKFHKVGSFIYKAEFPNGLTEWEFDHVCIAYVPHKFHLNFNPDEVQAFDWVSVEDLAEMVAARPNDYTYWLKEMLKRNVFSLTFDPNFDPFADTPNCARRRMIRKRKEQLEKQRIRNRERAARLRAEREAAKVG
jgi:isopentenyl-diphosphate delta-isomerase